MVAFQQSFDLASVQYGTFWRETDNLQPQNNIFELEKWCYSD